MTRQPVVARRAEALLGTAVVATAPVAGGDIATATKLRLSDGTTALMKTHPRPPEGFFAAEARGLRWLADAGGAPVPDVLAGDEECVIIRWVEQGKPTTEAAVGFGQELAATHAAGAPSYGLDRDGFIGRLPLPNEPAATWAEFYAERRIRPYLRMGRRARGGLGGPGGDGRVGARASRRPGARGAAGAAARRPVERQRALGQRRPRLADRPRRARRPPRDRPGDARPLRAAAPGPGHRGVRRGRAARRRLAGPDRRCTSCSRCSCTPATSAAATPPGPRRPPPPSSEPGSAGRCRRERHQTGVAARRSAEGGPEARRGATTPPTRLVLARSRRKIGGCRLSPSQA